jgi:hypothetical protein
VEEESLDDLSDFSPEDFSPEPLSEDEPSDEDLSADDLSVDLPPEPSGEDFLA